MLVFFRDVTAQQSALRSPASREKHISFWRCLFMNFPSVVPAVNATPHVCRVVQIGKALQDQRWLFESLMVQVEERRSAVENNAKQIEDRLVHVKKNKK